MAATKAVKKKHWYLITITSCELCSAGETIRTRMYGEKPKDPKERREYFYFACDSHFL